MPEPTSLDAICDALGDSAFPVGAMSSPDGALTLLLCDLDAAPTIAERLGEAAAGELLRNHRTIVEGVARRHDGEVVKVERDAVMISFASSHAGLRCAVDLHRTNASLDVPLLGTLPLRTGLHSGFVIASAGEVFGRNVVIAARIAGHARAGEILVSAAVKQYTETDPSFRFHPRGAVHFRGVHGEHDLFGVDWRPLAE
jgi:class 3 adenylate cyclase